MHGLDLDLGKLGLLPLNANTVTREDLAQFQERYKDQRPKTLEKSRERPALWIDDKKKFGCPRAL